MLPSATTLLCLVALVAHQCDASKPPRGDRRLQRQHSLVAKGRHYLNHTHSKKVKATTGTMENVCVIVKIPIYGFELSLGFKAHIDSSTSAGSLTAELGIEFGLSVGAGFFTFRAGVAFRGSIKIHVRCALEN